MILRVECFVCIALYNDSMWWSYSVFVFTRPHLRPKEGGGGNRVLGQGDLPFEREASLRNNQRARCFVTVVAEVAQRKGVDGVLKV